VDTTLSVSGILEVEGSVLHCFGDVMLGNVGFGIEVGEGAGDAADWKLVEVAEVKG
jgi:hypothetical protein